MKTSTGNGKVSLGNKLAFSAGDIFGGGSFNIINFLFVPFLTLVVGIPMYWVSVILLFSKFWDGLIDPFIGTITDGKKPGKFGKRRYFMLIFAPIVFVALILLFFPWNLVTDSVPLKIVLVIIMYMLYATAQSFVLIPYYSHASEMTDDFTERNKVNAVRIAFSLTSSIICVVVPGMIASPTKLDGGRSYLVMAAIFGVIFAVSILVTALFSREQIVTPPVRNKVSLKQFFRPLKVKTYRQYLGMQMCTSMGMAVMSSFFFTYCDFYLRRYTYLETMVSGASRFPIATVAAGLMFFAQIIALPLYLYLIRKKGKRFAYIFGAALWIVLAVVLLALPAEGAIQVVDGAIKTTEGVSDWAVMVMGLAIGLGIGGTMFIPHSAFGDVCDVGQLYFGERTEGAFSGLTNFLNTTAQAIGLALPPIFIGMAGYVETQYISKELYESYLADPVLAVKELGMALDNFKATLVGDTYQIVPMLQVEGAQQAIRLTLTLLPIAICVIGIIIALRYKLNKDLQSKIVALNQSKDDNPDYEQQREQLLNQL